MRDNSYLNIMEFWTRKKIPYIFDETLSLYQLVRLTVKYLNEVIKDQNELKDAIKEFIEMFDEDLEDTVIMILEQWKDDGSLKEIINEALFESKLDKVEFEKFKDDYNELENLILNDKKIYSNVLDYGAKGDGVTDDTEAIKKALKENSVVVLPSGTYCVSETIFIGNNKSLIGTKGQRRFDINGSVIKWCGEKHKMKSVIVLGSNDVGDEPVKAASSILIENIIIDGSNNVDFGLYGTYVTNETEINNVTVSYTNEYGIYIARSWFAKYTNLLANWNNGRGMAFGMPLHLNNGSVIEWETKAPLELNACYISNVRAHSNGQINSKTHLDGYGLGFGHGNGLYINNYQSELNKGVGVYVYSTGSIGNAFINGYIEASNIDKPEGERVHLLLHATHTYGQSIVIDNLIMQNKGGILHKGEKKMYRLNNIAGGEWLRSEATNDDLELHSFMFKHNCNWKFGNYNNDINNMLFDTSKVVNTRWQWEINCNLNSTHKVIYARRVNKDIAPVGSINVVYNNGTTRSVSLSAVKDDEFVLVSKDNNVRKITKGGGSSDKDSEIEIQVFNLPRTDK